MSRDRNLLVAMAALLLSSLVGLALRPLLPIDETRYLAVAWEMHLSGDWLVPTKNFALYSDKPPLLFWAINLIWMLTGVSEFAARMVGPLSGCVALWLTSVLGRRLWPDMPGIGGRAALALTGLVVFALSASLTMFDVPLTVFTLAGLIALSDAGQPEAGRRPWVLFGAAIAFGVLTKGPVILFHLLPAAILLPWWGAAPLPWRRVASGIGLGLLVAIGLLALWLVPAAIFGGAEYREAIFWHQSAGRLATSFAHAKPWWFYLALLPLLAFPLFWGAVPLRSWKARGDRGLRLCLIWFSGALILFSLTSGKQIHYLVPELPALALLAARVAPSGPNRTPLPAVAVLAVAALAVSLIGLGVIDPGRIAPLLKPAGMLLVWSLLIVIICLLAIRRRGLLGAAILSLGSLTATNLLIGATLLSSSYSSHPIAERIAAAADRGSVAVWGGTYHAQFNFAGRLTSPVAPLASDVELEAWLAGHPQGLLIGPTDELRMNWTPQEIVNFRNQDWAIWAISDAPPVPKREPPNE